MDKTALASAIKSAMDSAMTASQDKDADVEVIRQNFANNLADAVDTFVKTIEITIGPSMINVTGSAGASTNPAPITISNTPPNSIS